MQKFPQSIQQEWELLGVLATEPHLLELDKVYDLGPKGFSDTSNRLVYETLIEMHYNEEQKAINPTTLKVALERKGKLEYVGGEPAIHRLFASVIDEDNLETLVESLEDLATKRAVLKAVVKAQNDTMNTQKRGDDIMANLEQELRDSNNKKGDGFAKVGDVAIDIQIAIDNHKEGEASGIPCGIAPLDAVTGGWQKGDLIIIAGRPGMGKTALAIHALAHAAKKGNPGAFFSLEMSNRKLGNRFISQELFHKYGYELPYSNIVRMNLTAEDKDMIRMVQPEVAKLPIFIDDTPGISIQDLRAKARRLKAQAGIELIAVDYLTLMTDSKARWNKGREERVTDNIQALKNLAKELDVPVIVVCQLSRKVEERADKRPLLSDLRESGGIEQAANIVLFPYRPGYYGMCDETGGPIPQSFGEVIVAKNRDGATVIDPGNTPEFECDMALNVFKAPFEPPF